MKNLPCTHLVADAQDRFWHTAECWPERQGGVRTWGLTGREVALSAGPLFRPYLTPRRPDWPGRLSRRSNCLEAECDDQSDLISCASRCRVEVITVDRRTFISSLALGTLVVPHAARVQPARKVARIGLLGVGAKTSDMVGPQPTATTTSALLRGLLELGYVYGEHFVTEPRGSEGQAERFPVLAAELVRLQVDVIVAAGPLLVALQQATSTIPIVMAGAEDPVGWGVVEKSRTTGYKLHRREQPDAGANRETIRAA